MQFSVDNLYAFLKYSKCGFAFLHEYFTVEDAKNVLIHNATSVKMISCIQSLWDSYLGVNVDTIFVFDLLKALVRMENCYECGYLDMVYKLTYILTDKENYTF